jgi:hypothetical protein
MNRYIASFDTEDDGKGNPYLWAIIHEKGSWYTSSREKAIEYVLTLGRDLRLTGTVLELWATNLEYDIVNLFGEARIKELSLSFGKSYLVGAAWPGHNVIFRDTVRHIPLSVKELGAMVGIPKLEMKKGSTGNEAYCVRDATITRRTAKWLDSLYAGFNMAPKQTLAASALAIWKTDYWKREIRLPSLEIVTKAKEAYHGGRTEAFAEGIHTDVKVLDVASMFPWAMITGKFPIPWGPFRRVGGNAPITESGVYQVIIESNSDTPSLPVRTDKGTIYPNGVFDAWYIGAEIAESVLRGVKVRVVRGYEFLEQCDPFKGYVKDFYALKEEAKGPARLGYKLLLNALYGKFGQTGEKVVATTIEKFTRVKKPPNSFRVWNGLVIYSIKGTPPPWGNNVWSALITARARIRLAQEMARIREHGGKVLYCDTDSIIYQGADALVYPEKAAKIGDFELRGQFAKILIAGKKEYGLWDYEGKCFLHAKGVPQSQRETYLLTGRAEYQKPNRLRESARRGLHANLWETIVKIRKVSFAQRVRKPDGTFEPITIRL